MKLTMKCEAKFDDAQIEKELQHCVEQGMTEQEATEYMVARLEALVSFDVTSLPGVAV